MTGSTYFVTGGTLGRYAECYVDRQVDSDLYETLMRGEFCYVLNTRQIGKSSLMVRVGDRLIQAGLAVAVVDLTAIGNLVTAPQWYSSMLHIVGEQLHLSDRLLAAWRNLGDLSPLNRLLSAFGCGLDSLGDRRLVIFFDEIDATRNLPFSPDEFFGGLRELYNRRAIDPRFNRLTICLLGVAAPSDLISDARISPFNIARQLEITDFRPSEVAPLVKGLSGGPQIMDRVMYWTDGHPYLTQRLCRAVAELPHQPGPADVDAACRSLFLSRSPALRDDNLEFVSNRILQSGSDLAALLTLYARVLRGHRVPFLEANPLCSILRLSGIVRLEASSMRVRNRIYRHAFDQGWIHSNMPDAEQRRQRTAFRRGVTRAAAVAAVAVAAIGTMAAVALAKARQADLASRRANALNRMLTVSNEKVSSSFRNAQTAYFAANQSAALARQARGLADRRAAEAASAEARADRALSQTKQALENLRSVQYVAACNLASRSLDAGRAGTARQALAAQPPSPGEGSMRGFEWRLLSSLAADQSLVTFDSGLRRLPLFADSLFVTDGGRILNMLGDQDRLVGLDLKTGQKLLSVDLDSLYARAFGIPLEAARRDGVANRFCRLGDRWFWRTPDGRSMVSVDLPQGSIGPKLFTGPSIDQVLAGKGARYAAVLRRLHRATNRSHNEYRGAGPLELYSIETGKLLRSIPLDGEFEVRHLEDWPLITVKGKVDGEDWVHTVDLRTGRDFPVPVNAMTLRAQQGWPQIELGPNNSLKVSPPWYGEEVFIGHTKDIFDVAAAPDGSKLLTVSADTTARVWSVAPGAYGQLALVYAHDSSVRLADWLDNQRFVTVSASGIVKLWDLDRLRNRCDQSMIEEAGQESNGRIDLGLSQNGAYLALQRDQGPLQVTKLGSRAVLWRGDFRTDVFAVATSTDGQRVAAAGPTQVELLRPGGSSTSLSTAGHRFGHLEFANADRILIGVEERIGAKAQAYSWGGSYGQYGDAATVSLFDLKSRRRLGDFPRRENGDTFPAYRFACKPAISSNAKLLGVPCAGLGLDIFDVEHGRLLTHLGDGAGPILSCAFSPDCKLFATAGEDGFTRVYHTSDWHSVFYKVTHDGWASCVWFTPDGKLLLTGGIYYELQAYRTADFTPMFSLKLPSAFNTTPRIILGLKWDETTSRFVVVLDKAYEPYSSEPFYYMTLSVPPLAASPRGATPDSSTGDKLAFRGRGG